MSFIPVARPTPERSPNAPSVFHVMAKPSGAACNLDCGYCFYLGKEAFYPGSRMRMSSATQETFIRQMVEAQGLPDVTFAWQGGEPTLMGLEFFEDAVALQNRYTQPGTLIHNTLQTNGVLVDERWCRFLAENNYLVGISIDGPSHLHDVYRVDKAGAPTHQKVLRAVNLMREHNVQYNILCTVHAANADAPLEVYRYFRDQLEGEFIQFIPIVERVNSDGATLYQQGSTVTERSIRPAQWGEFLITVFDEWIKRDVGKVFVQTFEAALASWTGSPAGLCIFAETCGDALALEHNGDLYACDHFVEPGFLLGNIHESHLLDLVASEQQRSFGAAKRDTLPNFCRVCEVRFACQGECPKNRFTLTPEGQPGLNYLCAGYKAFFKHIDHPMKIMAGLLRKGRTPAGVMHLLALERLGNLQQAMSEASPNETCPCGSGRIFKRCHGRSKHVNKSRR